MASGDFDELLLAGYAPLRASGFALPCYAASPRPNAWHVAACSVDGDHAGTVAAFEPYGAVGVEHLPADLHRRVAIGAPWLDVFLWEGVPLVGTPAELLDRLQPVLGDVAAAVPVSLLDLCLAAGDADVRGLAEEASRHVERGHGAETAARWRRDTWTAQARLAVRRQLAASGVSGLNAALIRRAVVKETAGGLALVLPETISSALAEAGGLDPLREQVRRLGERVAARSEGGSMGLTVATPSELEPEDPMPATPEAVAKPMPQNTKVALSKEGPDARTVRILVVFSGPRSRAVARHVTTPDWVPVGGGGAVTGDWQLRRGREVKSDADGAGSVIDVLPDDALPVSFDGYDVVAWLLDDAAVMGSERDSIFLRLQGQRGDAPRALHLLAPALPLHEPSRVLDELALSGTLPFGADAVVDTSIARSPFWTGNPWRAIDRRTADVVVGSALVCALDERVRASLLDSMRKTRSGSRPAKGTRLLSLATDRVADGRSPEGVGFVSETTVRRIARRPDRGEVYEFDVAPLRKAAARIRHGWVSLSPPEPGFGVFAEAAIGEARRSRARADVPAGARDKDNASYFGDYRGLPSLERVDIPDKVAATLASPQSSAGFALRGGPPVVVLAEAPTLKTLRAAGRTGVAVARYTDRETLLELLEPGSSLGHGRLPREIRLPALHKLKGNKGLATRGVDPRDVVLLPRHPDDGALSELASSAVSELARGYVPRIGDWDVEEIALPLDAVAGMIADGGPVAEELRAALGLDRARAPAYALKRPSDLRVAWSPTSFDASRFVVEDGRFPIEVMQLPQGMVPAQRMFIVDGDASVPLLLGSRLFSVWARATTSRSTSWLSRFSVGGTFETLPIPRVFRVRRGDGGLVRLTLRERGSKLAEVAAWLGNERDGGTRWSTRYDEHDRIADAPIWRDADAALLAALDLEPDATDVDVLERMVAINREDREPD